MNKSTFNFVDLNRYNGDERIDSFSSERSAPVLSRLDRYIRGEPIPDVCRGVGLLIDLALERRLGSGWAALPRWQRLCQRFEVATRLKLGFWDMGLRGA